MVVDDNIIRPAEVALLVGDASRASDMLGWSPTVGFAELVTMMVDADIEWERMLNARVPSP